MSKSKKTREIEAEGMAYIVCEYFRPPNSLPESVVRRGADAREVMECIESITETGCKVANYLIRKLTETRAL